MLLLLLTYVAFALVPDVLAAEVAAGEVPVVVVVAQWAPMAEAKMKTAVNFML